MAQPGIDVLDVKTPIFSILSAVRNEARHISEMIASVQAQSIANWELVFVDDGSEDTTIAQIQQAALEDPRIRLVGQGRIGKVAAFNLAMSHSRGFLISLLAGDDRLPPDSLRIRWSTFAGVGRDEPAVAFFKIRTFSQIKRYNGMVLPRGTAASRSGGSITLTRPLANKVFPIPPDLPSEDIWLSYASEAVAQQVRCSSAIVLDYRIHEGNSNPRRKRFADMTEAMHLRHRAWLALLIDERISFTQATRDELDNQWRAEKARYAGRMREILLLRNLPLLDRLAMLSMTSPLLFRVRQTFYSALSGWRKK